MANYKKVSEKVEFILIENLISSPPVQVIDLAKNYGLDVRSANFNKFSSKVAGLLDLKKNIIFVNKDDSDHRKAFTVAHELGHFLLHADELKKNPQLSILFRVPLGKTNSDPLEQEANAFAARLLVPTEMLNNFVKENINDVSVLADIFGVSREVVVYRLKDNERGRL